MINPVKHTRTDYPSSSSHFDKLYHDVLKNIQSFLLWPIGRAAFSVNRRTRAAATSLFKERDVKKIAMLKRFEELQVHPRTVLNANEETIARFERSVSFVAQNILCNMRGNRKTLSSWKVMLPIYAEGNRGWIVTHSSGVNRNQFSINGAISFDGELCRLMHTSCNAQKVDSLFQNIKIVTHFSVLKFIRDMMQNHSELPFYPIETVNVVEGLYIFRAGTGGKTLITSLMEKYGEIDALPLTKKFKLLASLIKGLSLLHGWGIVHGDFCRWSLGVSSTLDSCYLTNFYQATIKSDSAVFQSDSFKDLMRSGAVDPRKTPAYERSFSSLLPPDYAAKKKQAETEQEHAEANQLAMDYPNDIWHLGLLFADILFKMRDLNMFSLLYELGVPAHILQLDQHPTFPIGADDPYRLLAPLMNSMLRTRSQERPTIQEVSLQFQAVVAELTKKQVTCLDDIFKL